MRQSKGVSSASDGMVKDQAGSTKTPIVFGRFGRVVLSATQAHGWMLVHGMRFKNTASRFSDPSLFMGVVARWSRRSIDVRSPAESRNVVGVRQPKTLCVFEGGNPPFRVHAVGYDVLLHRVPHLRPRNKIPNCLAQ
jgi:hypothetical protein